MRMRLNEVLPLNQEIECSGQTHTQTSHGYQKWYEVELEDNSIIKIRTMMQFIAKSRFEACQSKNKKTSPKLREVVSH